MTQKTDIHLHQTTDIVFILDRSGSMGGRETDTIGGYNGFLAKQQAEPGNARVTTVLFDTQYDVIHEREDIKTIEPITDKEYYVRGSTALLDAIGKSIHDLQVVHDREGKTKDNAGAIFVIITDGQENASSEYSYAQIRELIQHKNTINGWEFMYLGADLSQGEDADRMGFARDRQANYDKAKSASAFDSVSDSVRSYRNSKSIANNWRDSFSSMDELKQLIQKMPVIHLQEGRFLIASDLKESIGDVSSITLFNTAYPLTISPMLQRYRRFSGLPIDGMIGRDILSKVQVLIERTPFELNVSIHELTTDLETRFDSNGKKTQIPLSMIHGHLGMMTVCHRHKTPFVFDTKAHMTTLRERFREEPVRMVERDFHIELGLIRSPLIELDIEVKLIRGTKKLTCITSLLPEEAFIGMEGFAGSLGLDSFKSFRFSILNLDTMTYSVFD